MNVSFPPPFGIIGAGNSIPFLLDCPKHAFRMPVQRTCLCKYNLFCYSIEKGVVYVGYYCAYRIYANTTVDKK